MKTDFAKKEAKKKREKKSFGENLSILTFLRRKKRGKMRFMNDDDLKVFLFMRENLKYQAK